MLWLKDNPIKIVLIVQEVKATRAARIDIQSINQYLHSTLFHGTVATYDIFTHANIQKIELSIPVYKQLNLSALYFLWLMLKPLQF